MPGDDSGGSFRGEPRSGPEGRFEESSGNGPTLDDIFEILSHPERRELLYLFTEADEDLTSLDEVASQLSDRVTRHRAHAPDRTHLQVSLQHVHLPKLADLGLVEYDERREECRYRSDPTVEDWLELARQFEGREVNATDQA